MLQRVARGHQAGEDARRTGRYVSPEAVLAQLEQALLDRHVSAVDVVLSDMAPNTVGHRQTDHLKIIALIEKSLRETNLPCVAKYPQPDCLLMNVEGGIARYAVRYWLTDLARDDPTDSMVRSLIDAALRRNDRRLTPPIFNVFMAKEKQHQDARHKRHTVERTATLRKLPKKL